MGVLMPAAVPSTDVVVMDVTTLAGRYARVLISRRLLRAFAASTLTGAYMLLGLSIGFPAFILLTESTDGKVLLLVLLSVLVLAVSAAALGLVVLYVRVLSALARGSRRAITVLLTVVAVWLLVVVVGDVSIFLRPRVEVPLHFLALGALGIHIVIACGLVVGPFELRRSDEFARAVFAEPRLGAGLLVEICRLLDFPDIRALSRRNRVRAWSVLALSLVLEGAAFYTFLKWSTRFMDAAERPLPEAVVVSPFVLVPSAIAFAIVTLYLSFLLNRLLLRWARRLRVRARRTTLESAQDVLASDSRPPVLFLRSFEKEQVPLTSARVHWALGAFDPGTEYGTLEEMVVLGLTYVGPVVAVADPSRGDAPVGAARWRLSDDEWQRFVEAQIARAGLVVVGVAATAGLRWEIEALGRSPGALEKTIFVCPPGTTREASVREHMASVVGRRPDVVENVSVPEVPGHLLAAARMPDGTPTFFTSADLTETGYHAVIRAWLVKQRQAPSAV